MIKQVFNPFLPLDTYIPDGEPHVFGDRVYLFGSHDKEGGETFCMLDYEIWSAPVEDLSDWSYKGSNYSARQDPLSAATGRPYLYAPDCGRGNDGRYYLYYCLSGEKGVGGYHGPVGVAVCDGGPGRRAGERPASFGVARETRFRDAEYRFAADGARVRG